MRSRSNPRTLALEIGIVAAIALYYIGGNILFEGERGPAIDNARDLIALQAKIGLNVEPQIQHFFQTYDWSLNVFVFFYAGPHFVLTYGFLIWTYWFRFPAYAYVRNAFLLYTASAFTFQWVFPVAPPRMVPELGLADLVTDTLPINGETPWIKALVNDVAALPSVHTGWALLVAVCAIRLTSNRWRWLWLAYPAMIMASILATANHFVWDIIAALAWLGATELAHAALSRWWPHTFHVPTPRPLPVPEPMAEAVEAHA